MALGWPLGRFPLGVASKTCLTNLSRGILNRWLNQQSWDLSIRRSCSTFRALRISQLRTLSWSVTPWTPERGTWWGQWPSYLSKRGQRGAKVPFDNSITGNFTVYEDRFKQFIAAIRPHRNAKSFSGMFVIIFGVNIAAEQKQGQLVMIFLFCISFHCLQLF